MTATTIAWALAGLLALAVYAYLAATQAATASEPAVAGAFMAVGVVVWFGLRQSGKDHHR